jgi:hypothetical protein
MAPLRLRFFLPLPFFIASFAVAAEETSDVLVLAPERESIVVRQTAIPEMGDSRIDRLLGRYFAEGLGGSENWERIESLNVEGTMQIKDREVEINAYQKKPDFMKLALSPSSGITVVLGYDGETAWRQVGSEAEGRPMGEVEARRFIHSARFGNHLLYPYARGKTIRFIDTVPVEGTICHQIRVELDTDYQVDYFIDIRTYREIKVENTDLKTGARNSVVYHDHIVESGMPVAMRIESYEEGEWVSSLQIEDVKVNSGVMPWMFHMPK